MESIHRYIYLYAFGDHPVGDLDLSLLGVPLPLFDSALGRVLVLIKGCLLLPELTNFASKEVV